MAHTPSAVIFLPADKGLPGLGPRHMERLRREAPGISWMIAKSRDELLGMLPDCHIAIVWGFKNQWRESAKNLRLIATPAAGREWIEPRPSPDLGVWFGTFHGELMAETVLGLMLAFSRGIKASLDRQKAEPWARVEIAGTMRQIRGSRALVLGFGNIGKWVGRLLKPMGVKITGVNRSDLSRPDYFGADDSVHTLADLDRLLPETDHLILALPGDSGTDRLIDARRLALLPTGACLYNIGRGNAVDEAALVRALESGALAGAGLDVYEREPLPPEAPIRQCPNVILMPHVSAFAATYMDVYLNELLPKIRAWSDEA